MMDLATGAIAAADHQRHNVIKFEKLLQQELIEQPHLKVEIKIDDYFCDGIYGRRAYIPAGTILVGYIHKFEQLNVLLKGTIVIDEKELIAPYIVISPPGTKRLAKALTDCEWLTVLRTDITDADKALAELVCVTEEDYQEFLKQQPSLPFEADNVKRIS